MRLLTLFLALAVITGCQSITRPTPSAATTPAPTATVTPRATPAPLADDGVTPLVNTQWQLASFDTQDSETPVTGVTTLTLEFAQDGVATGQGGCNSFGGTYEVQSDRLVLSEIVSTLMACADQQVMEQEQRYLQTLPTMTSYRLADDHSTLTLSNENGTEFLNFVRME